MKQQDIEPSICPGMSKGLCCTPTFMTISVFCHMNNLRKVIFYLPSDLLLNKEAYVAFVVVVVVLV